ncbi:hypothetical protein GCM10023091_32030 [Ravibacter arvi]|uniref:Uncharacterized protein n=1 Tax=Ravibacter arvi TaxID=2051041 RepID=A0ABP8M2U1_9BACT
MAREQFLSVPYNIDYFFNEVHPQIAHGYNCTKPSGFIEIDPDLYMQYSIITILTICAKYCLLNPMDFILNNKEDLYKLSADLSYSNENSYAPTYLSLASVLARCVISEFSAYSTELSLNEVMAL